MRASLEQSKLTPTLKGSCDNEEEEAYSNEMTENTPEERVKVRRVNYLPISPFSQKVDQIYKELAQQKKEKEDRAKVNAPKERDYETEQRIAVEETRKKEEQIDEKYAAACFYRRFVSPIHPFYSQGDKAEK